MKKTIWFVNFHAAPIEEYYPQKRTVIQAQYFQKKGYDVKIFCSCHIHNSSITHECDGLYKEEVQNGVPFVFVKTLYYGYNNFKRVFSYLLFTFNMKRIIKHFSTPDVVIQTTKTPFDYYILPLAKKMGAKYIVDLTDLWPRGLEGYGPLRKNGLIIKWFYSIERYIYSQADHCVFSMEGCYEYLKDRGWDTEHGGPVDLNKVHYVNNGIDLSEVTFNISNNVLKDEDLDDESLFKIVYVGSIRLSNNLDQLLDVAKLLIEHERIRFIIYGDGTEREHIIKRCKDEKIDNVRIKDKWVDSKYVPSIISRANINVLNYMPGWAHYGGSMNKMFMAFAVGKPILCNAGLRYSPIRDNNLGIDEYFENPIEYANAIKKLYYLSDEQLCGIKERAINVAKEYDNDVLNEKFSKFCELDL